MTELEQLKQDHATVKAAFDIYMRDYKGCDWKAMTGIMEKKIAKLEAEADPWRVEKAISQQWLDYKSNTDEFCIARYVRHLESENAAKDARIAELEAREVPPLDPKRVYKTAAKIVRESEGVGYYSEDAEPYPLQESK